MCVMVCFLILLVMEIFFECCLVVLLFYGLCVNFLEFVFVVKLLCEVGYVVEILVMVGYGVSSIIGEQLFVLFFEYWLDEVVVVYDCLVVEYGCVVIGGLCMGVVFVLVLVVCCLVVVLVLILMMLYFDGWNVLLWCCLLLLVYFLLLCCCMSFKEMMLFGLKNECLCVWVEQVMVFNQVLVVGVVCLLVVFFYQVMWLICYVCGCLFVLDVFVVVLYVSEDDVVGLCSVCEL